MNSQSKNLMLVPSLNCQASCAYCFGPHEGGDTMSLDTVRAVTRWQNSLDSPQDLDITFHGGEPLLAGIEFYRAALPMLRREMPGRRIRYNVQSNLWALTDDFCALFREHKVSIGTSLDGPEAINDAQRGRGYFKRTMANIERARRNGLSIGCICTFTSSSIEHAQEIFDFFVQEGLSFTIHGALPSLQNSGAAAWGLSPQAYGDLLVGMLDRYLNNLDKVRIGSLDAMCRAVSAGRGSICTFGDCLGNYLAVDPAGDIYACQRFAGKAEFRLGNVQTAPSQAEMELSPTWQRFAGRQERIAEECADCAHLSYCRGGCPYNVLAYQGGFEPSLRDPHCPAYRRFFDVVTERAMNEVLSKENMDAFVEKLDPGKGLLRKGKLLSIMRGGKHPYENAGYARLALSSVALAATGSVEEATQRLQRAGVIRNIERSREVIRNQQRSLEKPVQGLNNLYLHVTFACLLSCSHCYARAGKHNHQHLPVENVRLASLEAARLGFRQSVITGGEPLVHPDRDQLLEMLADIRERCHPLQTMLRSSFALEMSDDLLRRTGTAVDKLVISLDGDQPTHDARRGEDSYDLTVRNLRRLVELGYDTNLSLAAVLPHEAINGKPGESLRSLAGELQIQQVRFRPMLPLGRAAASGMQIQPETIWEHLDPREMISYGFSPNVACGIGQNLYVEPDGEAYPCYAWHGPQWQLGSITAENGLQSIIGSAKFRELSTHTVNTNHMCRNCVLRYLCGGACRAWNRQPAEWQTDLDSPPSDCTTLHKRARSIMLGALEYLSIDQADWLAAGLPIPEVPPQLIVC